jgi:DNA-binding transcriptional LysR family regulator
MSANIDLKRLRAFVLVAKNGGLRRASLDLGLSMPAVSIQLKRLEEDLGVVLFEHHGRRLVLTATGQMFLNEAETALEAFDHAIGSVSPSAPKAGRIVLSMTNDLARYFLDRITKFMKAHPDVDISLRVRGSLGTLGMVLDGTIDVGFGYFGDVPLEIAKRMVGRSGFSLLCDRKHPLAKKSAPTLQAIAAHRIITMPGPTDVGRRITRVFSAAGVGTLDIFEAGNCQTSREFAEKGIGAAIIHTACLGDKWPKTLFHADVSPLFGSVDMGLIYRAGRRLTRSQVEFIETFSEPQ